MRVLITGSRVWTDEEKVYGVLERHITGPLAPKQLTVVHGQCPTGADLIAAIWCDHARKWYVDGTIKTEVVEEPHPADWDGKGKAAGPLRNIEMVESGVDVCYAFVLPGSKGTVQCMNYAAEKGVPVEIIDHRYAREAQNGLD